MDDRTRTVAATSIIIGFFLIVIIIVSLILTSKKVLSPVPEEGGIKIIFLTPTPASMASPSSTLSVTPSPKSR
jgi:hypothetical protein